MRRVLDWASRDEAPGPAGAVAFGPIAQRLIARLRDEPEDSLGRLSAVMTRDALVILGGKDALPWVDGLRYCAPEPEVPGLWLPTHTVPRLPIDLLHAALTARVPRDPLLLWHEPEQIVPLDRPAVLTPALLAWLERELE